MARSDIGLEGFAKWLDETERKCKEAGKNVIDVPIPPENEGMYERIEFGHDGIPPCPIIRQSVAKHEGEWCRDISDRLLKSIFSPKAKIDFSDCIAATENMMRKDCIAMAETMGAKDEAERMFTSYEQLFTPVLDAADEAEAKGK